MTVAAAAVALLALSAAPASGGFRYVPPAEAEAAAEPAAKSVPDDGAGDIELPGTSLPGTSVSGTSVSDPFPARRSRTRAPPARASGGCMRARCCAPCWRAGAARAGTEVLFLTDRRYRLDGDAAFQGGFADAAQALFRSLSHLPHAPVAARSEGGTTLVVRHRARRLEEGEDGR